MMRSSAALLALCLVAIAGQRASAETLKFLVNLDSQTFTTARDAILNKENGNTTVKFSVKKRGTVVVTYTSGCYVTGVVGSATLVTIYVKYQGKTDFTGLPPTYSSNRFCGTVNGSPGSATTSVVGGAEMPAGNHALRVYVQPVNGATSYLTGAVLHIQD